MSTVIRIKRHLNDEPVEAIVLKRRKLDTECRGDSITTVLNLSGTVFEKDNEETLQSLGKRLFQPACSTADVVKKKRKEAHLQSEQNQFKVISCLKHLVKNEAVGEYTIVDVDCDSKNRENEQDKDAELKFVYDLYTCSENENNYVDLIDSTLISVQPWSGTLEFGGGDDSYDDTYANIEDEDSNDESNWRNDYPDSDNSINEDDMRLAHNFRGLGLENESSSDDGQCLNYDNEDVNRFGDCYASYKERVTRELNDTSSTSGDEDAVY